MRKWLYISLSSALLIAGLAGLSLAGYYHHGCGDMKMGSVADMDTNKDGVVSLNEFTEPHLEKYKVWFEMLDTDGDGSLNQEEWDAFLKDHGQGGHSEG